MEHYYLAAKSTKGNKVQASLPQPSRSFLWFQRKENFHVAANFNGDGVIFFMISYLSFQRVVRLFAVKNKPTNKYKKDPQRIHTR